MRRLFLLLLAIPLAPAAAQQSAPADAPPPSTAPADKKPLTLDAIYGPEGKVDFSGPMLMGLTWLPDGEHYLARRDGALMAVDALTDEAERAWDADALAAALKESGEFDEAAARRFSRSPGDFTPDRAHVLIEHQDRLYGYSFVDGKLTRFTPDATPRREARLSPKGRLVAYVKDSNLFVADAAGRQTQLTRDGSPTLLNGLLDWVYQEEVYGRGSWAAFWWSADEQSIAYLQLDESAVPSFTLLNQLTTRPAVEQYNYPKPGDPNPKVRLGIVRAAGGPTTWVNMTKYGSQETLIVNACWAPDGKLLYQVQDREQRWLDLNEADPQGGKSRTLIAERTPAWVNRLENPTFLTDGSFLWQSERDGFRHLYHYNRDGRLIRRVTGGDWEVRSLHGVDPKTGWVYFSGTRDSSIEEHAYRVRLDGGPIERLTEPGAWHRANFDPQLRYFFDTFSNVSRPSQVVLRYVDGTPIRTISENKPAALEEYAFGAVEFHRVPTRDGFLMNAMLIKPHDFDPQKKYPVWSLVYGGPQNPIVSNRWGGSGNLLHHYVAQHGYLVWVCDPRSASGAGAISSWHAYRRLGVTELQDLEDGVTWLSLLEYVDPQRVGIWGHSYGGFMTAFALTHSTAFKVGIAVASPTDWRLYDTIYTERYMQTPQNNPEGYDASSAVKAAAELSGKLLLIHGLMDDNVHWQNSEQLMYELQKARRPFDLMIYPRNGHGMQFNSRHWIETRLRYLFDNL
ncbi:Prolyl tripeptidyl peptidase precursor [Phycisphaerae bacterium RAS1]|nr:Prolyl tripeptidyl peptidase precursor [Phycisphaerae bacterium RAS1]